MTNLAKGHQITKKGKKKKLECFVISNWGEVE